MLLRARSVMLASVGWAMFATLGCHSPSQPIVRQSQYRAMQLYQQNQSLAMQSQSLAGEKAQLEQQVSALTAQQNTLQQRVDNLQQERGELQKRYVDLVNRSKSDGSPLSDQATRDFEELAKKYPDFDFDPHTGVSKFHSDILFESGSSELRSSAIPLLQEFAKILNKGDSTRLNILVVGHTDDRPIAKPSTRAKHLDNWELSAHRAVSVTRSMGRFGLAEKRMGVAGYGPYQPLVPNTDEKSRQRNRRVEIFVLAPNAAVAGWDSPSSRN